MKILSKFLFLFVTSLLFLTRAVCAENFLHQIDSIDCIFNEYRVEGNKIYIQASQLNITDEGIFIVVQGELVLVCQLNCEGNEIYCLMEHLDRTTDKCYNGHKIWCGRCGGCVVRWCKFRCKCVEWK